MANHFRNILPFVVPRWLSEGEGELVLYTLGMMKDASSERMRQALEARFPTRTESSSALDKIGADRGIPRGRSESAANYAQRLIGWRYPRGHRVRGSAFALLDQVSNYWGGLASFTIDVSGNRHDRSTEGVESYSYGNAWDWDGAGATPNWSRFWFGIFPGDLLTENPDLGDPALWGGALGDPDYTVGQVGATAQDAIAMRELFTGAHPWKPAGTRVEWFIVALDGTWAEPDGTWDTWSVVSGDHRVPSRYAGWRFWAMDPNRNQYTGDAAAGVHGRIRRVAGTLYTPVAGSVTLAIPMPDGTTYNAVDRGAVSTTIQLIDDGGLPV